MLGGLVVIGRYTFTLAFEHHDSNKPEHRLVSTVHGQALSGHDGLRLDQQKVE